MSYTIKIFFVSTLILFSGNCFAFIDNSNKYELNPFAIESNENSQEQEEFLVELILNEIKTNILTLTIKQNSIFFIREDEWKKLNFKASSEKAIFSRGEPYFPLKNNITANLDKEKLILYVQAEAVAFTDNQISKRKDFSYEISPLEYGGYINYDFLYDIIDGKQSSNTLSEIFFFTPIGIFYNELIFNAYAKKKISRLNTNWQYQYPEKMLNITIGDNNTTPGSWGKSALFAGIQFKTNFSMQPNFAPYPGTKIKGESILPSSVELYLDQINLLKENIKPGPFTIDINPPAIGNGTIKVVTTDALGRKEIIDLPFYASTDLLAKGVHEFAIESGFLRKNYSRNNFSYGNFFINAIDRFGVTERFTEELHAEIGDNSVAIGGAQYWQIGNSGILSTIITASSSKEGEGGSLALGYDYQKNIFSSGVKVTTTTPKFTQIGQNEKTIPARKIIQLNFGLGQKKYGNFNIAYLSQDRRKSNDTNILSLNYNKTISKNSSFYISTSSDLKDIKSSIIFLNFIYLPYKKPMQTLRFNFQKKNTQTQYMINKNIDSSDNYGYQLQFSSGNNEQNLRGNFHYNSDYANYSFFTEKNKQEYNYRLNVSGSLVSFADEIFLAQPIFDSFAIVSVPGFSAINVYQENSRVKKTNKHGKVLLPNLTGYHKNKIHIDNKELPLNIAFNELNKIIIPANKYGVYVPFDIKLSKNVTLTLNNNEGIPMPPGTEVYKSGNPETRYPVAFAGELYIEDVEDGAKYIAEWQHFRCGFTIKLPTEDKEIALIKLGAINCESSNV